MQQQELQLKAAEQQRKAAKDQSDAQFKAKQLELEQLRLMTQHENNKGNQKNDMLKTAAQLEASNAKDSARMVAEAVRQISSQKHTQDMKKQDVISRNLQAVMAAKRNVPKKGE
jgi:hypothetical protein